MIQSVLGELVHERETVATQDAIKEEEGSSSMPGKEDMEDVGFACEVQIIDIPIEQVEFLLAEPRDQSPIMVEVSASEGNEKGLKAFGAEEEVQIVTPPAPSSLGSIFMNTPLDSFAHYERLKKKRPVSTATAPIIEGHPFF